MACSPGEIINEVCSILRSKAEENGLALEAAFDGPMPRTIQSDPTRFRQVLMNVAGNAIKFTPAGRVRSRPASSRPAGEPAKLIVEISDTGIGIPADKLESIFDPFTQADSSITRQFGGTGLGLAISRRLAEQLGGAITVESEVGRGTTFTCELRRGIAGRCSAAGASGSGRQGDSAGGLQSRRRCSAIIASWWSMTATRTGN